MNKLEFDNIGALEEVSNSLARGSLHDVSARFGTERRDLPSKRAVWNNRDDELAYMASDKYDLVQHREVIDAVRDALRSTTGNIEKGMIRDYGTHVEGVVVFGGEAEITAGEYLDIDSYDTLPDPDSDRVQDVLGLGMRFTNSFDGSKKVTGETMAYRYICQNWMIWGKKTLGEMTQAHIHMADEDFFSDIIGDVFETRQDIIEVIDDAGDEMVNIEEELTRVGYGPQKQKRIQAEFGEERTEASRWSVYNAVTRVVHEDVQDVSPHTFNEHQTNAWNILA